MRCGIADFVAIDGASEGASLEESFPWRSILIIQLQFEKRMEAGWKVSGVGG